MLPIPDKLLKAGVRDMVRISDARMSGTSYGACVLHVSPESAVGGPLALVQTGDFIELDVEGRRIHLDVSNEQLLDEVYGELRQMAAAKLSRERPGQTLQATALVHDAYIRLVDVDKNQPWESRGHFFSAAQRGAAG